jgi:hypothetical protein
VPKAEYASRDFYDVWLPELAPSLAIEDDPCARRSHARNSGRFFDF